MSWFGEGRAIVELRKQRMALERIATCLEEMMIGQKEGRGTAFRTFYKETGEDVEGEVLTQTDEEFAEMERLQMERAKAGGPMDWEDGE